MIVDGLIPTGLTIIAGAPKSCKSWMMLTLALSVSLGKPFLGHDVKQCGVAYYALEDTDARLKSRLLDIGTAPPPGMIYATSVIEPSGDFISDLENCLNNHPEVRLVIVDTLQKIRNNSEPVPNASQYGCEYEELTRLKDIADRRKIAIVLVHHTRKKHDSRDGNNDVLGSSAVTGTADMILILRKNRGGSAGTLSVSGRDARTRSLTTTEVRSRNWTAKTSAIIYGSKTRAEATEDTPSKLKQRKNYYAGTDIINMPIRSIKLKTLKEWAYGLIAEHDLTQKEYGNVATWMKQMFEYAAMEEIIVRNPYPMLKITNRNVFRQTEIKSDENKVLSEDMELALYKECIERFESRYYPVHQLLPLGIIMLFQAGLRPSELITLRYEDVDGDEIVIRRYYSDKADAIRENRTKAGHGFRRIILTSLAKELIEAARKRQLEEGIEDPEYIFMMNDQFKSFYDRLRKTFPNICKKIGIPQNSPYSGRRSDPLFYNISASCRYDAHHIPEDM